MEPAHHDFFTQSGMSRESLICRNTAAVCRQIFWVSNAWERYNVCCTARLNRERRAGECKGEAMQITRTGWAAIVHRFQVADWLSIRVWAVRVLATGVFCGAVAILIADKL